MTAGYGLHKQLMGVLCPHPIGGVDILDLGAAVNDY